MNVVNSVVVPSVIFVVLDGAYMFLFKNYINKTFGESDSLYGPASMKTLGFVINILIELFALVYFLILGFSTIMDAFIFGAVLQGYASSINYATVKDWGLSHSVVCTLWKAVLFALTVYLSRML